VTADRRANPGRGEASTLVRAMHWPPASCREQHNNGEELAMNANEKSGWVARQARWAMLIAGGLASVGSACTKTPPKDSGDTTTDTPVETCREAINCPTEVCVPVVQVSRADLEACYGWTGTAWPDATPLEVKGCDPGNTNSAPGVITCDCDLPSDGGTDGGDRLCRFHIEVDLDAAAQCVWGNENDPVGSRGCAYDVGFSDLLSEFADSVARACPLSPNQEPDPNGCNQSTLDFSPVVLGPTACADADDCQGHSSAAARSSRPAGTSAALSLDPVRSFLAVSTPLQSVTVRLSGEAYVDLNAGRLLGLQISADQTRFASSDWKGFTFTLDKAVALTRAGEAFRIPVAQRSSITGIGRRDDKPTRLRASASSDVTGHLSMAQKTWDLEFTDQSTAGGFTMHLAGRIAP
jgi:hypothetical protein